jgi:hypothetical protein
MGGSWTVSPLAFFTCSGATCTLPNGAIIAAAARTASVSLPVEYCGAVEGLCGHYNPDVNFNDTFTTADGSLYTGQGRLFGTFQSEFGDSFAADATSSLFTEQECPIPTEPMPEDPLPPYARCPGMRAIAEAECPQGDRYDDCVMDVGYTCELWPIDDANNPDPIGPRPTPPPTPAPTCDLAGLSCETDAQGRTLVSFHSDMHQSWHCENAAPAPFTDCTSSCTCHPDGQGHRSFVHHNGKHLCVTGDCGEWDRNFV